MQTNNSGTLSWLRKLGWIGFMFFLVKGLVWLALGYTALGFLD